MLKTIMVVDDDDAMRDNLEDILKEEGYVIYSASTCAEALQIAAEIHPGVALLDLKLPDNSGMSLLGGIKQVAPDCMCALMTAFADVDSAVAALEKGAFHYLQKPVRPIELLNLLQRIFETVQIREEKRSAEERLKESERRFRTIFESAQDAIYLKETDLKYTLVNPVMERIYGIGAAAFIGRTDHELFGPQVGGQSQTTENRVLKGEIIEEEEVRWIGGSQKIFHSIKVPLSGSNGNIYGLCGFARDLTATRRLEAQLLQAQKMEAIGTLAGGISHDFNNLLQAILGYTQILLLEKKNDHPDIDKLKEIEKAAQRATGLTRQLLAFGRKVEIESRPVDINLVVRQVENLLRRTIPKMIHIELRLSEPILTVVADAGQMEQVLLNIAVNARDAMPDGGTLIIETANVDPDEDFRKINLKGGSGAYVLLSVSDTGHGMSGETLERIFEPFFTTKKPGQGTGLGLAMAYGIVKNHHGHITCQSGSGTGTTFKIYLPAININAEPEKKAPDDPIAKGQGETILVIDDEPYLRSLAQEMLTGNGYRVLTAASGEEGVLLYRQQGYGIGLILLDLIMPGMGGKQCLAEILKLNPRAKVLISSGYTMVSPDEDPVLIRARAFVSKPYNFRDMLQRIRSLLAEEC
ncbi:MAG: response regulator [Desulfobacteraceae bacterium]|nr:MAG: response regulator [Desulfobacteraceae bacterium]